MKTQSIKNLIFDLGGVILDLSVESTLTAFAKLSALSADDVTRIFKTSPEFNMYEKGGMTDNEFREFIRRSYSGGATDHQIDNAWNAMLVGLRKEKLDLLDRLRNTHQVFLLSNTNGIHLDYINQKILLPVSGKANLDVYFHKAYYSHRMLKRKPDAEIFEQVLQENELNPAETLFLDDNLSNVEGAKSLGIQTLYVTHPNLILEYFK